MKNTFKSILFLLSERINPFFFGGILYVFRLLNLLKRKPKILIFTDSRGFEVTKFWNRKNPFSSYVGKLVTTYSCTVKLCPEKFTSLLDFLYFYSKSKESYFDFVILHCGVVDFAPRPESSFDQMYSSKIDLIDRYKLEMLIGKTHRQSGEQYEGEVTYSFLNEAALNNFVLPELSKIKNLIYVGINPVLNDWQGAYWRMRPNNINEQMKLDDLVCKSVAHNVCLSFWDREQIMKYTSDNVHYTKLGFNYIHKKIISIVKTS